ncbi:hypothetical protein HYW20_04255 [Candidatus Woesearchaeota archaeon]|nr:hypothetical protein [Candidatus Woesearchaeota archaeon]
MENERLNLFELHYTWYEHEHQSTILATPKEQDKIEEDLKEAATSIEFDEIKEKEAVYKDDAYRRIINILRQKGYIVCNFIFDPEYHVDEIGIVRNTKYLKYGIIHRIKKTECKRLR